MLKVYHVLVEGDPLGGSREAEKIAIALNEIGVPYEVIALNRARDMRPANSPYRRNINHMGTVPTLDDDDFLLRESGAILSYLMARFPDSDLVPQSDRERAKALEWVFWEGTTYCLFLLNLCFLHPFKAFDPDPFDAIMPFRGGDREADLARAYRGIGMAFQHLDNELQGVDYIANNRYSVGDIALGAHVALAGVLDIDLKPYPNVGRWLERLAARAAWQAEPVFASDWQVILQKGLV